MKVAIVYGSYHHGNTKKLVDAISSKYNVTLFDALKDNDIDLTAFDVVGFASGIYYSRFYPQVIETMEKNLPKNKKVFFLFTCGSKHELYRRIVSKIAEKKHCFILGQYGCLGYDTYGPFKLVGGIAKGHPNKKDIEGAVSFFENSVVNLND